MLAEHDGGDWPAWLEVTPREIRGHAAYLKKTLGTPANRALADALENLLSEESS